MSLFVGNISSRIRPHELERVFQKFGQCRLELKDGYGFVIYNAVRDAEEALRELKGRSIFGQQLSIMWSKKQRPLKRFHGNVFSNRNFHNRNQANGSFHNRGRNFQHYENSRDLNENAAGDQDSHDRNDFLNKAERGDHFEKDKSKENDNSYSRGEVFEERDGVNTVPLENDRWGEPLSEASGENHNDEETNSRRYDARKSKNQIEGPNVSYAGNYPADQERDIRNKPKDGDFGKSTERCYFCGHLGHVQRHCQLAIARANKLSRFMSGKGRERIGVGTALSRGKGPRNLENQRPDFARENAQTWRKNTRGYSRNDRDSRQQTRSLSKKRKFPRYDDGDDRKELNSDSQKHKRNRSKYTSSRSVSRGRSESASHRSKPRQRSRSHQGRSSSSDSSSDLSKSHSSRYSSPSGRFCSRSHSRSRSRSRSRTRSQSQSRSRSVSHSQPRSAAASYSRSQVALPNSRSPSTMRSLSVSLSPRVASARHSDHKEQSPSRHSSKHFISRETTKGPSEDMNDMPTEELSSEMKTNGLRIQVKAEHDLRVRIIQDNEKDNSGSNPKDSGNNFLLANSDKGDYSIDGKAEETVDIGGSCEIEEINHNANLVMNNSAVTSAQPRLDEDECSHDKRISRGGTNILIEEVKTLLENSKDIENLEPDQSLETCFGAARFWPWVVVRYRRLKRGGITTENYAKRVIQNKTFHITDKYVRSSSGWWESDLDI